MLQCLSAASPSSSLPDKTPVAGPSPHPPPSEGNSADETPRSSGILSPINVHHEYTHALQSDSYRRIWTMFQVDWSSSVDQEVHIHRRERILTEALQPDGRQVREALGRTRRSKLTDLTSAYFDESERATELFIVLQAGVHQARQIYAPLLDFLSLLPLDAETLTVAQCRTAHEIFTQFNHHDSPFAGSATFKPMRDCSVQLKDHLTSRVRRSRSRIRLVHRATSKPGLCIIGTAAIAAVSAAAVTAHSIAVAAVAAPCIAGPYLPPRKFMERELARSARLSEAARVVYALSEHLETVDSLIERLQTAIEGDRRLVQIVLERGVEVGPIWEVVKQLRKSPSDFLQQLDHLVVDTCLWFTTVNRARELLFREICSDHDPADAS